MTARINSFTHNKYPALYLYPFTSVLAEAFIFSIIPNVFRLIYNVSAVACCIRISVSFVNYCCRSAIMRTNCFFYLLYTFSCTNSASCNRIVIHATIKYSYVLNTTSLYRGYVKNLTVFKVCRSHIC